MVPDEHARVEVALGCISMSMWSSIYPVSDRRNDVAGVALVIILGWQ